jgi:quinol-cytochrome oxidoreductase complex cytochrome b subunit
LAATTATQVRPRREREEELLVWPDLVFVEFICAVLFTFSFTIISALVNAPLINRANPDVTPNPSKAPWYFLNLQELLLHMNPALAGVVVPTVLLIVLAAVPYLDRSREGQGTWFGTPKAVAITVWSSIFALVGTVLLILLDSGKHAEWYERITGKTWLGDAWLGEKAIVNAETGESFGGPPDWAPGFLIAIYDLVFSRNFRAIQTEWTWNVNLFGIDPGFGPNGKNGVMDWPDDFTRIPVPLNGTSWPQWGNEHGDPPPQWYQDLPDWLTGLYWYDLNVNLPAVLVEILIPTLIMVGLPAFLIYLLWRIGWVRTRRDVFLSLFSGFIVVYFAMTIVGAAFRGAGQDLSLPWDVPRIDG